ncbi:hypothetical protein CAPTEDRAFT_179176 [Capitella teleta]|uniref:Glutamate [NMDA] receptor subunit 1 n=1 Tax=Capitella teleta TaxID=283909 RepID=R7VAJ8_CAPTE|nr:hypothetical protein CAPTEDRAFT_179176 [Capitella teleta]|eukprot:ELU12705.1 hypothetical protein CAPTEDRAFT_179176 [Capitella teleta]
MRSFLLVLVVSSANADSVLFPSAITIGAVLSSPEHGEFFSKAVEEANSRIVPTLNLPEGFHINHTFIEMNDNPIRTAKDICEDVIPRQVYVVIASHSLHWSLSTVAISFTCGFYKIPVIGISARESTLSDKNVHSSFMRTVPPYSDQAEAWAELMKFFEFKRVILIHSSDQEGRAMLGKFQSKAETKDIEIEKSIQYTVGQENFTQQMAPMLDLSSRVVLLYAVEEDAHKIYAEAARLNLTGDSYAWFVTEQALRPSNVPQGTIGLQLIHGLDEDAHIHDSITAVATAFSSLYSQGINITSSPVDCSDQPDWPSGLTILRHIEQQKLEFGRTGKVTFNDVGDRLGSVYSIVNVLADKSTQEIGTYRANDPTWRENMQPQSIIWPGNQPQVPKGIKISTYLRVVTIEAKPFIYADPATQTGGDCGLEIKKIHCPKYNSTDVDMCCYGYAIDLLLELSKKVNFTFNLHIVEDTQYGELEKRNSSKKTWNGMIGELVETDRADMIVAPLTINPERAAAIDFSKPFKYQGLTILVKKTTKDSSLASFLQPFQDTLWILVMLSVHVVALVLYLLDRFSPFGRFKLAKSDDTEEDALNLSSAMWFAWGVLLNSGIGEGTPRSFSARVLGMVWAGFAMIIVASYTANLAAFLVLDRPEASISGIDDARLRNPQEDFKYATVKHSSVAMYFKRQVELSTMYRTMESRNYRTAEEAISQVKSGDLQAFIWDSSRLDYEAAKDCDLVTAGELFGRSGYGIGLPKDSPWTQEISLAILGFHENGYMEQLDGRWILVKDTKCPEKDASPATLGLTNMAGVFMMVAGGIVAGVFLIFIEIAYKRHRGLKEKELELAKTAADRWRGNIEKRRTLRRTLLQQQQERNKVNNGTSDSAGGSPAPPMANRSNFCPPSAPGRSPPTGYLPVATRTFERETV